MSITNELRRLLDERGVEYKDRDMFGKHVFHWGEPLHGAMFTDGGEWTELVVENATPEQAVEATLGRGTCHDKNGRNRRLGFECTVCGVMCSDCDMLDMSEGFTHFRYCPACGRKVRA